MKSEITNPTAVPTRDETQRLIQLFNQGQYAEGVKLATTFTLQFPDYPLGWKLLGACLKQQGLNTEAVHAMKQSVRLQPTDAEAHSNLGVTLKSLGRLSESEVCLQRAIDLNPDFLNAYTNLAATYQAGGKFYDAESVYCQALKRTPESASLHFSLGKLFQDQRKFIDAERYYRQSLAINPGFADGHNNLGNVLVELQRFEEAETCYRSAIELNPESAAYLNNLGGLLKMRGRFSDAEKYLRKALEHKPDYAEAQNNLGTVLRELGRLTEAVACFSLAIQHKPDYSEAHNNLGITLKDLGRFAEAEKSCCEAIRLKPDYFEAYNNLGTILQNRGRLAEAEKCLRKALEITPNHPDIYYNLGHVANADGRLSDAESNYRKALLHNPYSAEAYNNLGNVLKDQGLLVEAEIALRRALEIKPDYVDAHSNLLFTGNYSDKGSAAKFLQLAKDYGTLVAAKVSKRYDAWLCEKLPARLRVGLVSGDFCRHPVGYFIENLLSSIDADQIELIAYSSRSLEDDLTVRLKPYFSKWELIVGVPDEEVAKSIVADAVHILIDLSGHTAHNRLPLFAWKPAPVQVTWLGYFATTGVAEIDYLLADPWTVPNNAEAYFTETIWRLPETRLCFTAPSFDVSVSTLPALHNGYITFGCFSNLAKMTVAVLDIWARILLAIPNSRLLLKAKQLNDSGICQRVMDDLAAHGIEADRLLLEGPVPRAEYLAAYQRVDIVLDTFPFPGGTTTVEALWMGVPVLTLFGDNFISRQGVGLLANVGLMEWIARDADDYIARVVVHASDLNRLASLRTGLRQQLLASPVCDAERFARHFEAALWGMWDQRKKVSNRALPMTELRQIDEELVALFNAKRYDELELSANQLLSNYPEYGFAWKVLGAGLQMSGKNALLALTKAVELLPNDAEAASNLAVALQSEGKLDEAAALCRKALKINPKFVEAYNNLGNTLKDVGQIDAAKQLGRVGNRFHPAPPHQTVLAVFPHTAFRCSSP